VEREASTKHPGFSPIAVILATLAFAVLATSAIAQEVKTDNQQQTVETAKQDVTVEQQPPAEQPAQAATFNNFKLSWDTTVKYSNAFRVQSRSRTLTDPSVNPLNANQDDGDRNFKGGLISDRLDILSEIDLVYKSHYGIRASGAAWGDQRYNEHTDNNSPFTYNAYTVPYTQFPEGTRDIHMAHAELLDAFAFAKFDIGKGSSLSIRGGQFAQQYGESLFFGAQGIAGGMAPVDLVKLLAVPSSQFKEIIRPVPQVSMQFQINPSVSIGAYYQLAFGGWGQTDKGTRFPAVGSYFSTVDILGAGAERLVVGAPLMPGGGPAAFFHARDMYPKDWGQFGGQVKVRAPHGVDLGFYAIQFHDKAGQLYLHPLFGPPFTPPPNPQTGEIGTFQWVYPENVKAVGVSATKTFGTFNWAAELSTRIHQDLTSDGYTQGNPFLPVGDNNHNAQYAIGDSVQGQISWIASLKPNFISKEASWAGELAWNDLLSISKNPGMLDPNTTRNAVGFRTVYEPVYRQWKSGMDLSFPIGFSFFPLGKSAVFNGFGPDKGGDYSVGVALAFRDAWRFGLTYNGYYGDAAGFLDPNDHYNMKQNLADRGFVAFSVRRTFGVRASH
jgi:Protein of unknown function (DUF1302)